MTPRHVAITPKQQATGGRGPETWMDLFSSFFKVQGKIPDRFTVLIDKADAEIAQAGTVDDGAANDVGTLVEREALGDAVIHNHAPITEEGNSFFAVEPPHGRRIRAHSHTHVLYFSRAIDDGNGPEQDAILRFVQAIGEAKELDVPRGRVQGMPCEFHIFNRHFVAVMRNHGELVGKVLGRDNFPDVAFGK
jgi:hypothetical protein